MLRTLFMTVKPSDISAWAQMLALYLGALAMALVTVATALLRGLHVVLPIVEKWYPRTGRGEWRPKIWGFLDRTTWTVQRLSGAGHLPRQKSVTRKTQIPKETIRQ